MNHLITIGMFCIVQLIINFITFYQAKHIEPTFWNLTVYNFKLLPLILIANILFTYTFSKGIKWSGNVNIVNLMSWSAIILVTVLLAIFYFKEIPKSNVLLGLVLAVLGVIIANYK